MSKAIPITVAAVASLTLVVAIAAPLAQAPRDYSTLPPAPADVQQQLAASKVTLTQAVATAQEHAKGLAGSASMRLNETPPAIEVVVYADEKAQKVLIDAESGAVLMTTILPRFPGESFEGDLVETESGVKYFDLKIGDGEQLTSPTSVFQAHLTGWLVDGTEWIDTRQREPMSVPLQMMEQQLAGFVPGITGMKVGGKRKFILPPALAYGEQGQPPVIPANATLIFDIELLALDPFSKVPEPANLPGEPIVGEPVVTDSGLTYYDLVCGEGAQPEGPASRVKVHYTGWLVNGTKFDSSVDRGQPYTTALTGVIPGWTEGVASMKVGGKRKLIVPYNLAYGEAGDRGIPPKATLIFDIELLEVLPAAAPPAPPTAPATAPSRPTTAPAQPR